MTRAIVDLRLPVTPGTLGALVDGGALRSKERIVHLATNAETYGALFLLGVRLALLGAFVAFFFHLRRQARLHADRELDREWSELQRDSRRAWRRGAVEHYDVSE